MDLKEFKKDYIFTTRIEIDEENYVVLREPTTLELRNFSEDEKNNLEILMNLLPEVIVDHSFTSNGKTASAKEVANALESSGTTYTQILETYMDSLPFKKKESKKLEM